MKRYSIDSPDRLKAAAPLMKQQKGVWAVNNLAIAWSATARQGKPEAFTAYIEMGRSATLYRISQGVPLIMGEMFLGAARKFVKDLKEVPVT